MEPNKFDKLNNKLGQDNNLCQKEILDSRPFVWELIEKRAKTLLDSIPNKPGYIFNLGHGILPKTPEENVRRLVNLVQNK